MIAIVTATKRELDEFLVCLDHIREFRVDGFTFLQAELANIGIVIVISGVGRKKARSATSVLMQRYDVSIIISAGFAGALHKDLKIGDVIVADSVENAESGDNYDLVTENTKFSCQYSRGHVLTSRYFINSTDQKQRLYGKTSALCVDMETSAVVREAKRKKIPAIAIRTISDLYRSDLPRMEKLFKSNSRPGIRKMIKYFLTRPLEIYPFIKFFYFDAKKASSSLADALTVIIPRIDSVLKESL